jgi:hypothetical protein
MRLTAKDVALITCFTALYAVFAAIPLFQLLGMPSKSITAAAITVPIIGIILGPYVGTVSAILGGTIGFFYGSFAPWNFVSGTVATLCAGLLYKGKRIICFSVYFLLLIIFGFYPTTGPVWLFPLSMWFQIACLFILASPLQSVSIRNLKSNSNSKLAGQISGSLTFMMLTPNSLESWLVTWQGLTIVYPVERIIIALGSALIGASLFKILRSTNLLQAINRESEKFP